MEYPEDFYLDYRAAIEDLDIDTVEAIRFIERVEIFNSLRNLIQEKQSEDDSIAEYVLGWAYERLADG
jgi:hypothetical protein